MPREGTQSANKTGFSPDLIIHIEASEPYNQGRYSRQYCVQLGLIPIVYRCE